MPKTPIKKLPRKLECIDEILLASDENFPEKFPDLGELKNIVYNPKIDFNKKVTIEITPNNESYIAKIYQR